MKIIVVGGAGTLGQAIVNLLKPRHEIIVASRKNAEVHVDVTQTDSIEAMYQQVGAFDALVYAAGMVPFKTLDKITVDDYRQGLENKLLGQINLVLLGLKTINDRGSFTLTSGILNRDPIVTGSAAATVNAAIEGFVKSASIEMPRSTRINAVSPTVLTQSLPKYGPYFRGFISVNADKAALAYSKSVEGQLNGQVFKVFE